MCSLPFGFKLSHSAHVRQIALPSSAKQQLGPRRPKADRVSSTPPVFSWQQRSVSSLSRWRSEERRVGSDWSSDVCSSDLPSSAKQQLGPRRPKADRVSSTPPVFSWQQRSVSSLSRWRSEERRVGKECR